ncbi:hypothetical protein [Halorussus aquaticus]|uniref:Uncharacterized protein n=1 Tax=Halorussus aquaticus TaxID=2953748 RepID=A0ABD5Q469_9EURY|nr:hypothetical protein [Halorussus aquaticus]
MDRDAIFVGAGVDAVIAVVAATMALPERVRWPAFAGVLAGGLFGGYLAGRLAAGSWRRRTRHGLLAGVGGGAAFALAVRWSFEPGTPPGALRPANYLLATAAGWLPSGFTARYDALLGVAAALAFGVLYAVEGALAAGAAPGGDADVLAVRE